MRFIPLALCAAIFACNPPKKTTDQNKPAETTKADEDSSVVESPSYEPDTTSMGMLETSMIRAGLINVNWLNKDIKVDLRYSTTDNFLALDVYGDLTDAYLEVNAAKKLALAQHYLAKETPGLFIKVWDAARPIKTQQKMWDAVQVPAHEKGRFVSNPKNHSLHNYGCAVDVTLIDSNGVELDMGTGFDQFDSLAQPKYEMLLLQNQKLHADQLKNRKLLRRIMRQAGFTPITSEWWHFNSCTREYAKVNYQVLP